MAEKPSDVDQWLERETPRIRRALESASRYFDAHDELTVNTLEAVYGRESSFGTMLGERGSTAAAGHFHFKPQTAEEYGLSVSKHNDQRFDIDDASSAAARYLKNLDTFFSKRTLLGEGLRTIPVSNSLERRKFVFAAYNGGQGRVAAAQQRAEAAGKKPSLWAEVKKFLESETTTKTTADEMRRYVEKILPYEAEFASKSPAEKTIKSQEPRKGTDCADGRWRTIDDHPVHICD